MNIKEVWASSFRLYRKSLPQVWHLGAILGVAITISMSTVALSNGFRAKTLVGSLIPLFASMFFVYVSSLVYLKIFNISNEKNMSWRDSLFFIAKRYIKVAFAMLFVFIVVNSLGTIALFLPKIFAFKTSSTAHSWILLTAFVLPGIFTFVLFSMTQPLVLLDDKGIFAGMKDSCKLIWGKWWRVFSIMFPLMFINYWIRFLANYATIHAKWHILICGCLVAILFYPLLYTCTLVMLKHLKAARS